MMAGTTDQQDVRAGATPLHLTALAWTILCLVVLAGASWWGAGRVILARTDSAMVAPWRRRLRGVALHRAALRHAPTIPAFGSSELTHDVEFRPDRVFASAPTGFVIYPMGEPGVLLMHHVFETAALGEQLRGRRVIVFVPPNEFAMSLRNERRNFFAGNFSRLHAATMLANGSVPTALQRDILARLSTYREAMDIDPLIAAQARLATLGSPAVRRWTSGALQLPLWLEVGWLGFTDRLRGAVEVRKHPSRASDILPIHAPIPWDSLAQVARAHYEPLSASNPYGLPDPYWARLTTSGNDGALPRVGQRFDEINQRAEAWIELDLLLRTLSAVGARPVVVCLPLAGRFMDATGGQQSARIAFHQRLNRMVSAASVPMLDFEALDGRPGLLVDLQTHLSPVGWVAVNQQLDSMISVLNANKR